MFHENLDEERAELTYKLIIKIAVIAITIVVLALNVYVITTT